MFPREFGRSAWKRVGICTAAGHKQCGGTRVPALQGGLSIAGVIAVEVAVFRAHRGVVACISKPHRDYLARRIVHSEYRNVVIYGSVRIEARPPVRRKPCAAVTKTELRGNHRLRRHTNY